MSEGLGRNHPQPLKLKDQENWQFSHYDEKLSMYSNVLHHTWSLGVDGTTRQSQEIICTNFFQWETMYSLPPRPSNVLIAYQARQCNVHIAYLATCLDGALSLRPGGAYVGQRLTLVRTRSQLRCKTGEPHSFGYVLWLRPPSFLVNFCGEATRLRR